MDIVFTLYEKNYNYGVCSLLNSLIHHKFAGIFYVYYRGAHPFWLENSNSELLKKMNIEIICEEIKTNQHLAQIKPTIALELLDKFGDQNKIYYFDPDIVVIGDWDFFRKWASFGVAIVEEIVNANMAARHPLRLMWIEWAETHEFKIKNDLVGYYNSGFFAVDKNSIEFLKNWENIIKLIINSGFNAENLNRSRVNIFSTWDQDAMNIAIMTSSCKYTPIGPEGMGFIDSGYTMLHATGKEKPWERNFFKNSLKGNSPRRVDKEFIRFSQFPFCVFSKKLLMRKKFNLWIAKILSKIVKA